MPRYFFDVLNFDIANYPDDEGVCLEDLASAAAEANKAIRELLAHSLMYNGERVPQRINVRGNDGEIVYAISSDEILPRPLKNR